MSKRRQCDEGAIERRRTNWLVAAAVAALVSGGSITGLQHAIAEETPGDPQSPQTVSEAAPAAADPAPVTEPKEEQALEAPAPLGGETEPGVVAVTEGEVPPAKAEAEQPATDLIAEVDDQASQSDGTQEGKARTRRALPAGQLFSGVPGFVYAVDSVSGKIWEYSSTFDQWSSNPAYNLTSGSSTNFNGLGIGEQGNVAYVFDRGLSKWSGNGTQTGVRIWKLTSTGWSQVAEMWQPSSWNATQAGPFASGFIVGAVNPKNNDYYFGRVYWVNGSGVAVSYNSQYITETRFEIYRYNNSTKSISTVGYYKFDPKYSDGFYTDPSTGRTSSGRVEKSNGDIAFDSNGNLLIVRGSDNYMRIVSVKASTLAAVEASGSNKILTGSETRDIPTSFSDGNGIAFNWDGTVYIGSNTKVAKFDPNTGGKLLDLPTPPEQPIAMSDLASFSVPSTITIRKNVVKRAAQSDQFTLTLQSGNVGTVHSSITTNGVAGDPAATGIQDNQVGPLPATEGTTYNFNEAMATGSGSKLDSYAKLAQWSCTEERNGVVKNLAVNSGTNGSIVFPEIAPQQSVNVVCTFTNKPTPPGSVSWTKTDPSGQAIAETKWEIHKTDDDSLIATIEDCTDDCFDIRDQNSDAGAFNVVDLELGKYYLIEVETAPGFSIPDGQKHEFELTEDNPHFNFVVQITNPHVPVPPLPNTGGSAADTYRIGGLIALLAALGGGMALAVNRAPRKN